MSHRYSGNIKKIKYFWQILMHAGKCIVDTCILINLLHACHTSSNWSTRNGHDILQLASWNI